HKSRPRPIGNGPRCSVRFASDYGDGNGMQSNDRALRDPQRGRFIGRPLPRFEDLRLVRGAGRYTDDVSVPQQTFAVFGRAPRAARDAAEKVAIEYEVLPAVTDTMEALTPGAPTLWPGAPDNLALDKEFGDRATVERAIEQAHVVIEQTIRNQRTASAFMEP